MREQWNELGIEIAIGQVQDVSTQTQENNSLLMTGHAFRVPFSSETSEQVMPDAGTDHYSQNQICLE